ncbi:helix-turn-helix domain-containing protein [Streptomyces achromogenes]|uniref:helix-turn-helix domain-containing protein n=1 Tax=Streptomyces achromogenes TaxID=67255 RepID=UPI0037122917
MRARGSASDGCSASGCRASCGPSRRAARPAETLDALLMSWNRTAPEVARALDIPPQTARRRLRRLEELFGERLGDPAFRFAALLALPPARRPRHPARDRRPPDEDAGI